jgi:ABC-type phosphate/phosphonate transport system ATPase subunit
MLQLQQLDKRYPTGDLALKSVSLNVASGEVLGLIGPSGAGKSTLIRCVNRLVQPTAGQIVLDGQDLGQLESSGLRQARRHIGMIFQEYALVERLTVMENLLSGRLGYTGFWASWFRRFEAQDIEQAYALLERVGLGGMENKRADALSGGQRQRVRFDAKPQVAVGGRAHRQPGPQDIAPNHAFDFGAVPRARTGRDRQHPRRGVGHRIFATHRGFACRQRGV